MAHSEPIEPIDLTGVNISSIGRPAALYHLDCSYGKMSSAMHPMRGALGEEGRRMKVHHKAVVREAHKQYSETLNKTMLVLLSVALFCLLTTISSPDKLLLAAGSTIKVPFADAQLSFVGFIVVAPFLLIVLVTYLHIFFGYWLNCERERQSINQTSVGTNEAPIESIPTLFSFPDAVSRLLTRFIFYWLVPLVLGTMTFKAWALPAMGLPLTYVAGVVTSALVLLQIHRRRDNQPKGWTLQGYAIILLIIGLIVRATLIPQSFQRPLDLFRAELPKAWLVGINMRRASASFANLPGADLERTDLQGADLERAKLPGANLTGANLQGAKLWVAKLPGANLTGANLQGADLRTANLEGAKGVTQDQVNTACVDEHTQLPEGLTRPPPCSAHHFQKD
jgi:hypothetical protein